MPRLATAVSKAVPNDGYRGRWNAYYIQRGDLQKPKAEVQGNGGPELDAVRAATILDK